jgi:hypothetical protein
MAYVRPGAMALTDVESRLIKVYDRLVGNFPTDREQRLASLPIVLIYGKPESPVMKSDILPGMDYYNHRSGELFEVFVMGYKQKDDFETDNPTTENWANVLYEPRGFSEAISDVERNTSWRYSGQTDLIFMISHLDMEMWNNSSMISNVKLDLSSSICLCLRVCHYE